MTSKNPKPSKVVLRLANKDVVVHDTEDDVPHPTEEPQKTVKRRRTNKRASSPPPALEKSSSLTSLKRVQFLPLELTPAPAPAPQPATTTLTTLPSSPVQTTFKKEHDDDEADEADDDSDDDKKKQHIPSTIKKLIRNKCKELYTNTYAASGEDMFEDVKAELNRKIPLWNTLVDSSQVESAVRTTVSKWQCSNVLQIRNDMKLKTPDNPRELALRLFRRFGINKTNLTKHHILKVTAMREAIAKFDEGNTDGKKYAIELFRQKMEQMHNDHNDL